MKALRLDLYQGTVCYKTPHSTKVAETYPLPAYSTIIGTMHSLLEATDYVDMKVSVQGTHESKFSDYATTALYKDKKMSNITFMPYHRHMLYNVNLIVHISAEESVLEDLKNAIEDKGIAFLGRSEDIVRVNDVRIVNVEDYEINEDIEDEDDLEDGEIEPYTLKNDVYLPECNDDLMNVLGGVYYRLNHHYTKERKNWSKVNTKYVESGNVLNEGNISLDEDGDIVLFA